MGLYEKSLYNVKIKKRNEKNLQQEDYQNDLQNPRLILEVLNASDYNAACNVYLERFKENLEKHAPMKQLSRRETKLAQKPWLTKGIMKSISKKRTFFKNFKEIKDKKGNTDSIYKKYKFYRDLINKLKRNSKRNYYREYFNSNSKNIKETWKGINKLLNKHKSTKKKIFLDDNGIITDSKMVANKFNQYFINVADKLSKKIIKKNTKFQDYLKNPNKTSLFLSETTPDEIINIINQLDVNKSNDIYDISPKYVKLAPQPVAQLLSIFNRSINEGGFPEALKQQK